MNIILSAIDYEAVSVESLELDQFVIKFSAIQIIPCVDVVVSLGDARYWFRLDNDLQRSSNGVKPKTARSNGYYFLVINFSRNKYVLKHENNTV